MECEVLRPETVSLMSHNAMGDVACRPMKTAAPDLSNDVDFLNGMKWGLSFLIKTLGLATGDRPIARFVSLGGARWSGTTGSIQLAGSRASTRRKFFLSTMPKR